MPSRIMVLDGSGGGVGVGDGDGDGDGTETDELPSVETPPGAGVGMVVLFALSTAGLEPLFLLMTSAIGTETHTSATRHTMAARNGVNGPKRLSSAARRDLRFNADVKSRSVHMRRCTNTPARIDVTCGCCERFAPYERPAGRLFRF